MDVDSNTVNGGNGQNGQNSNNRKNHNSSSSVRSHNSNTKQRRRRNKQSLDQLSDGESGGIGDRYRFRAHKSVLSSVSSVFNAMLNSHLKEREESLIEIGDMCFNTVYYLLQYAYTNQVDNSCDLRALFAAAEKYQIYDLCHMLSCLLSAVSSLCNLWP